MSIDLSSYRARIGLYRYKLLKLKGCKRLNMFESTIFLAILLYRAGDVEKNPGPESDNRSDTSSTCSFPVFQGNFSVVDYNVQSLLHKVDIIRSEFSNFDVVSLTGTWINNSISTQELAFNEFQLPLRRDRTGDSHGGIAVYVKNGFPCKRRNDLELISIECLWLEINIRNRKKKH